MTVTRPGLKLFAYDQWANLLSIGVSSSAYNGCTQESFSQTATGSNQISGWCYDLAGNLQAESASPCPSPTYSYDAEGRLSSTAGVTYKYDGDGHRVEKSNGKLYWYGTGGEVLDETDLSGNFTSEYVFFGGTRVARRDSPSNIIFYYFGDQLGTSRAILQAGQTSPCYDADFYPFGGERNPIVNTCPQNYKFTGKERDIESNLDSFGARYDSSAMGRFMSPDPENVGADPTAPQSWNMYTYVVNNPLIFTDPTGMECVWDDGSFDAERDPQTGTVSTCQNAGGTWVELGQNGNWSSLPNTDLQNLVSDIQNGIFNSVKIIYPNGSQYTTNYNNSGQVTGTSTPDGTTVYGHPQTSATNALLPAVKLSRL